MDDRNPIESRTPAGSGHDPGPLASTRASTRANTRTEARTDARVEAPAGTPGDSPASIGLGDRIRAWAHTSGRVDARATMRSLEVDDADIAALGAVRADRWTCFELLRTGELLVVLQIFLPGQSTPACQHANSACLMRVLRGVATERRYALAGSAGARAVEEFEFLAGSVVLCAGEDIYSVGNAPHRHDRLVTLHVYWPAPDIARYAIEGEADL